MAKTPDDGSLKDGDNINQIRDILLGPQKRDYDQKFDRAFADVSVQADRGVVQLEGRAINEIQRTRAEAIARTLAHEAVIVNRITPDAGPSFPVFTALRAGEVARTLNRVEGVFLETQQTGSDLSVSGWIANEDLRGKVDAMFGGIPGLRTYRNSLLP